MSWDYVIVGAGSAGCVLAARLSEDPAVKVLVLEAGGADRRAHVRVPAALSKLFKTAADWAYYTENEPRLNGRRLYWPRGKMLGGCSSMNAMIYIRGNRRDYERWRELGCVGWDWASVERHSRKAGAMAAPQRYTNPLSRAFVEACVETGIPRTGDFNGPEQDGAAFYAVTQRAGRRYSAADAYLRPAMQRPNLEVRLNALATRVVFEKERAVAVEYLQSGAEYKALAAREIILAGGAVNSPQLLMLSGIGPADRVRAMGIHVIADLPGVGENLQDHLSVAVAYECKQPVSLMTAESIPNIIKCLVLRRGPLTSNIAEAGAFVRTRPDCRAPDLQYVFGPVYYLEHGFRRPRGHGFTFGPTVIRPFSRGRILLKSANPLDPPCIHANYLADERDIKVLVEGIRLARRIAKARAFDPYRGAERFPGEGIESDADLRAYIAGNAQTLYHPTGTCKMGVDAPSVVDPFLRVRGVAGLRVADASIMPEIVGGNTNAPVMMIAEKAAAMIRGEESAGECFAARP
jgi:choline dehydrogenase